MSKMDSNLSQRLSQLIGELQRLTRRHINLRQVAVDGLEDLIGRIEGIVSAKSQGVTHSRKSPSPTKQLQSSASEETLEKSAPVNDNTTINPPAWALQDRESGHVAGGRRRDKDEYYKSVMNGEELKRLQMVSEAAFPSQDEPAFEESYLNSSSVNLTDTGQSVLMSPMASGYISPVTKSQIIFGGVEESEDTPRHRYSYTSPPNHLCQNQLSSSSMSKSLNHTPNNTPNNSAHSRYRYDLLSPEAKEEKEHKFDMQRLQREMLQQQVQERDQIRQQRAARERQRRGGIDDDDDEILSPGGRLGPC